MVCFGVGGDGVIGDSFSISGVLLRLSAAAATFTGSGWGSGDVAESVMTTAGRDTTGTTIVSAVNGGGIGVVCVWMAADFNTGFGDGGIGDVCVCFGSAETVGGVMVCTADDFSVGLATG